MRETTVLIGTHYFSRHGGGIELVAGKLASAYAADWNMNVIWVSSDCDAPPATSSTLRALSISSWNGIERLIGLPYPIWSPLSFLRLWTAVGQANVVHIHDFLYFGNQLLSLMAAMRGKPVLVTQHIGFVPYTSKVLRWILSTINHTLGRLVLGRSSQVVFVSESVRQYFSRFTRFRRQAKVIPNGLDTKLFHEPTMPDRVAKRAMLSMPAGRSLLLFVGRFVEKKGLVILEQLAREFPESYWVLAGQGPIDPESWALQNVRVFPKLSQVALVDLYQSADLLVLPSKGEGFPLVVQEAMACGTPAIVGLDTATALAGLSGLIFSADSESEMAVPSWKEALRNILRKPSELAAMRTLVAAYASREWSWQKCAAAYAVEIDRIQVPGKK